MSTAARPTFHAAQGKSTFGGNTGRSQSSKDVASFTKLKFRQFGQASKEEIATKHLKSELDKSETLLIKNKDKSIPLDTLKDKPILTVKLLTNSESFDEIKKKYDDSDVVDDDQESFDESRLVNVLRITPIPFTLITLYILTYLYAHYSDEEDDDEDDDELELQRELDRIKAERAVTQAKKEQEENEIKEKLQRESALKGNPLVQLDSTMTGTSKVRYCYV